MVRQVHSDNPFEDWHPDGAAIMFEPFESIHRRAFTPINFPSKSEWNLLIYENYLRWILANVSNIIAAPDGRHYSNGLAERTWCTITQMARAFITEK